MRYYKQLSYNYLTAIGTGPGGEEITETEYNAIMDVIRNRPTAAGKGYRLRSDLTWEEYDLPPEPEVPEELTTEEKAAAFDAIAEIYEEEGNDT